jgi:adenine-specific DNA-methyltransferase
VQKPEPISTAGISLPKEKQTARNAAALLTSLGKPHNLCEIGKERIRRAAAAIRSSLPPADPPPDLGFRVLKLTPTKGK